MEVALLKLVIVPEFSRLTIPAALLVIPAIVPEPPKLIVPVFVKLARTVLIAPDPVIPIVPAFVSVVILDVPPTFKVPVALFVNPPAPESAVLTVKVPLLV